MNRFNKGIVPVIAIIIIAVGVIIGGGVAYYYTNKIPFTSTQQNQDQRQNTSTASSVNVSTDIKPLFGTMLAFNINNAAMGRIDTIQKGWSEFKKDSLAYQNLKSNLEKLIQDRTKLMEETGFSLDREVVGYFTWNVIEPQKGQFNWELTDLYTQAASNADFKISAVVQPFASWDQKNTPAITGCNALDFVYYDYKAGPLNDLTEYEIFLTKTVERYKDKVVVWEIGNEVEGQCGGYQNNPEGYLKLLKISYDVIKGVDPEAKVLNAGALEFLDDSTRNFWVKFFQLGGDQYLDYFNIHYNIERISNAKLNPATFQEVLTFFNNLMEKNGGKKPLYLTEFGIYSGTPSSQPAGQVQTNSLIQPTPSEQFPNQPFNDKCGDGICDDFEKNNPDACSQDCQTSSRQPTQQSQSEQSVSNQNLPYQSPESQAAQYFKYSILAFVNGVKTIFIDLVGGDNDPVGSSMAFNTEGQPRLFLTTLKTIESRIGGFSRVDKIADSQYKFTVGSKTIYALWSGILPNE
ncbi:MAG: beta-galactosidase, partial [bacterium]|nr:beta-galactosidase [bacterium]